MKTPLAVAQIAILFALLGFLDDARAVDETRRQVGSELIDRVFDLDGTGVNIGQVEGGVPVIHPNVNYISRGTDAPSGNTDPWLHALEVAGIMVSSHATFRGMAPGATLWSDDFTNNGFANTGLSHDNNWLDGIRWHTNIAPTAHVVNASHRLLTVGGMNAPSSGVHKASLGIDWWVLQNDFLFVKSAGNQGAQLDFHVTAPGANHNGMAVGDVIRTQPDNTQPAHQGPVGNRWDVLDPDSSYQTDHGISKPDLVAPGGRKRLTGFNMATAAGGFASAANRVGTSYAAPHVSGVAAQLYDLAIDTDHRRMKATLMNSADKTVRDRSNQAWATAGSTHGLDNQLGTGFLNAWGSAVTLAAPNITVPATGTGTRIGTISSSAGPGFTQFFLNDTPIGPDSRIVATVAWDRTVLRDTTAPNGPPPNEVYSAPADQQAHMKLEFAGPATFSQNSAGGSVQHLNVVTTPDQAGNYTLSVNNNGMGGSAPYSVAFAISPVDVNPGQREVFFTLRDQIHTPTAAADDRIREGRASTAVRVEANLDAEKDPIGFGVETVVWKSQMTVSNSIFQDGDTELGLTATADLADDAINALSFGRDNISKLTDDGGQFWFSVDTYATGLSPLGVDNPENGVFSEATIVNEASGDIFRSTRLLPGGNPLSNQNLKTKNMPDNDFLHPENNLNTNSTFADSYYLGLTGPRVADNEDDINGLEGLGRDSFFAGAMLEEGFTFFSLDRGSPSIGGDDCTGDIFVGRNDTFREYASADDIGLMCTDNLDALLVQHVSGLTGEWPEYDPAQDRVIFSVDRDSVGKGGSAVNSEHLQGEAASDLFWADTTNTNLLFLEATDFGLQEVALGNSQNWLTDNLDALDIANVPEPYFPVFLAAVSLVVRRRR